MKESIKDKQMEQPKKTERLPGAQVQWYRIKKMERQIGRVAGTMTRNTFSAPALGAHLFLGVLVGTGPVYAADLDNASAPLAKAEEGMQAILPIPEYSGDLFMRHALTGDWGGARTSLAENGLQFQVDLTGIVQGVMDGGRRRTSGGNGVVDYRLLFDTGRANLWPGGLLELHGETYFGKDVSGFDGALIPSNTSYALSAPTGNGTYLSHFTYTQFLSERFGIQVGRINTPMGDTTAYTHSPNAPAVGREKFMNMAFNFNPVVLPMSPYAPYGANFLYLAGDRKQHLITFSVWDGDTKSLEDYGLNKLFEGQTTIAAAGRFQTNFLGKVGHQTINFMYGFGDYTSLDQSPFLGLAVIAGRTPTPRVENGTWAVFYNFDQALVTSPVNPDANWGVFGRVGFADEKSNIVNQFYSIGLGGNGLIPNRPQDTFGIGYYYLKTSDELGADFLIDDNEQGMEAFYKLQVTPAFGVTANLQYIDGMQVNTDAAVVGALRARVRF